ncbi:YczE/YyaS/YitT family protein [Sporohalobacter salinus]|uniref:YczE/YyaS/YitT family protein n=1 Tax=Sporohalobacter salinus TaxID=1494606 RepID=UPI0019605363|nr:membrane protein [Sporohalobacter salinus]MBM7624936.1 putative membrane protein YczE [Sporohalobacter salinus]
MKSKYKWTIFLVGLTILSMGIVLIIKANLGVSPWSAFHIGLTNYFDLTIGRASQITGLVVIMISYLIARVKPNLGTIINIFTVGILIDSFVAIIPTAEGIIIKYIYLLFGIIGFGGGVGIYMSTKSGTGPRDGLMIALKKKLNLKLGLIRNGIELTVLLIGYFLGGPIGVGTVLTAISIGPIIEYSLQSMESIYCKTMKNFSCRKVKNVYCKKN